MHITTLFDKIAAHLHHQFPFVAYRKANTQHIQLLLQENKELYTTENTKTSGFVFAPFERMQHPTILIPNAQSTQYTSTLEDLDESEEKKKAHRTYEDHSAKEKHYAIVQKAITEIHAASCEKIVISRKETVAVSGVDSLTILKRLLISYPNAFVYCWYHPQIGLWLGATPETLLTVQKNRFSTMALAGTQPIKHINPQHTRWGQKEITEQRMVTDYIVATLGTIATTIHCSETYTHSAGTIVHLRTDISGTLAEGIDLTKVINRLHPTPAVCGLPLQEAKAFISANEGYDRKYYTGFLGMIQQDAQNSWTAELFVNLRCMELISDTAIVYVGGGITKDSDPEKEWQETLKKSETIKDVL